MAELNTLAPKKWVANYSGAAPTIDTTDGVSIGDFAIDTSNDAIWRCHDNTDTAAVWQRLDLVQQVLFDTGDYTPAGHVEGLLYYDADDKTIAMMTDVNGVTLQVGQEQYLRVTNKTGAQIDNGSVVYISGAQGNRPLVTLADADTEATAHHVIGFATADIADNGTSYITTFGLVRGVDTSGITEGETVYLSQVAGEFTGTAPSYPAHEVPLGVVVVSDAADGIILCNIDNADKRLEELNDVAITNRTLNDVLQFNGTQWVNVAEPTFNQTAFTDNIILPKASGKGIQVDQNNPIFGWRDITADIQVKGGSNTPTFAQFSGNVWGFEFDAVNDQVWMNFHIPHDYVPGTDLYIHTHWGLQTAETSPTDDGNALTWTYYTSYASRDDVTYDTFPAETTDTTTHTIGTDPDIPALAHIVSEVQLTSGGALNGNTIEVDGILLASVKLTANTMGDNPFLFFVDIHYQSTNMATRSREPDFYDDNNESSSSSESSEGFSSSSSSVTNSTSSVA